MLGLRWTLTTLNKPLLGLCGVLIAVCFMSDQGIAQIKKVDGYDGYKFGMTIDQALKVKSAALLYYENVLACLIGAPQQGYDEPGILRPGAGNASNP